MQVKSQELNSTLHSTIFGLPIAFTNENVVFTCVTRGSNSMGWTSEQYIGTGGRRLEFVLVDPAGSTMPVGGNSPTVAELVSTSDSDRVIVSQLRITIQTSTFPIASVQCHDIGADTNTSIRFHLAGMYYRIPL
jgi:hypothetical protein